MTRFLPQGKISQICENKFILKRYSNVACAFLAFIPVLLPACFLDTLHKKVDPSQYFSTGFSLVMASLCGCIIAGHAMILKETQMSEEMNNEDSYLCTSIVEK